MIHAGQPSSVTIMDSEGRQVELVGVDISLDLTERHMDRSGRPSTSSATVIGEVEIHIPLPRAPGPHPYRWPEPRRRRR